MTTGAAGGCCAEYSANVAAFARYIGVRTVELKAGAKMIKGLLRDRCLRRDQADGSKREKWQ